MQKNHFLAVTFLIPTLMFGVCTDKEKQEMKGNGYTTSQISDICSEDSINKEENSLSTVKKSYISVEVAYVGQSGPGFYEYQGYYVDTITESQSVSGSGFSVGVGYTFDRIGHIKLKYKKLTSTFEDAYGNTIDDIDLSETTLSWTASTNPSGNVHFGYGTFIGFGSADFGTIGSTSFFTYGPEIGLIVDVADNFEIFTDLTWQQRSYSEKNGVTFTNFPFGLDIGFRYNFN